MNFNHQTMGHAIGRGLNWLLIASAIMLVVSLIDQPLRNNTLVLIGIPSIIGILATLLAAR